MPNHDKATREGQHSVDAVVAVFDARPCFEKALAFGVQHGLIDQSRLDAIATDAPKGMVQIARYFGSEFLRPELEKARERMVNLVSLYLEVQSHGDLRRAAESLRDNSFLSHSKGGSEMLKALIAMPSTGHFGMNENTGFTDEQIPLLAKWAQRPLSDYRAELTQRSQAAQVLDAAIWLADELGMDETALQEAGCDGEAVIRTALLSLNEKRSKMPDWVAFEKLVVALRKKPAQVASATALPKTLPTELREVVDAVRRSIETDWPRLMDATLPITKLFHQTPSFLGRYFWIEDPLADIDRHDRAVSATWSKLTGGHEDEGSLITLFLTVAAGGPPKTLLTEKAATALIRKIRKNRQTSLQPELAMQLIRDHAPEQHKDDYAALWKSFIDDSLATLTSDFDYQLTDALALLRQECNLK